jgi:hypothetical protein
MGLSPTLCLSLFCFTSGDDYKKTHAVSQVDTFFHSEIKPQKKIPANFAKNHLYLLQISGSSENLN